MLRIMEKSGSRVHHGADPQVWRDSLLHPRSGRLYYRGRTDHYRGRTDHRQYMSTLTKSSSSAPATPAPVDYLSDVHLTPGVRDFLKIVNAPDGKSIESLPLSAARQVLVDTQHALPPFIFIHGGGWVLGDYPTRRRLVRDLVVTSG